MGTHQRIASRYQEAHLSFARQDNRISRAQTESNNPRGDFPRTIPGRMDNRSQISTRQTSRKMRQSIRENIRAPSNRSGNLFLLWQETKGKTPEASTGSDVNTNL